MTNERELPVADPEAVRNLGTTLEYLQQTDEVLVSAKDVDPDVEVVALQKRFDGGHALLFDNVIGYPNARVITNIMATEDRLGRLFGVADARKLKFKYVEALRHPIAPREIDESPSQEVVIDKDIDVWPVIPMVSHTRQDPGRTLGGGVTLVSGPFFWGGSHIAYNRMNFRGPNYSSFQVSPGSHGDMIVTEWYRKKRIPMTINVGVPPAVTVVAASGFDYMILHKGSDELGVAGALQGYPVDIVKAKTVDAYALSEAEWVIEGYVDTEEKVWENPEAEKAGKQGVYPFHPEWAGYMGKAYRTYKFTATAITHRAGRPLYHAMGVHMEETHNISVCTREAALFELADRIDPGLCVDVHVPWGMTDWGGAVFQISKRRRRDEGIQVNILDTALATSRGMRMAIAVDEDINIYDLNDVMWALTTRVNPVSDMHRVAINGAGQAFQPADRASAGGAEWTASNIGFPGGLSIDATVPFEFREAFQRPPYPVDEVDPGLFFTPEQVEQGLASQSGWSRYLAKTGY